jgi:hypothetical protein
VSIIASYNFNEASGSIIDQTGNGRSFTPSSGSQLRTAAGAGYTYGGTLPNSKGLTQTSTIVDITGPAVFGQVTPFSLACWMFRSSNALDGWAIEWKDAAGGSGRRGFLWLGGQLQFRCRNSGGAGFAGVAAPSAGVWHHLAGVADGSTLKLFIDGVQVASTSFSGPILTDSTRICMLDGLGSESILDSVYVADHALTLTEINALKAVEPTAAAPALTSVANLTVATNETAPALAGHQTLTVADESVATSNTAPALVVHQALTVADVTAATNETAPALAQHTAIAASNVEVATNETSPVLTQHQIIASVATVEVAVNETAPPLAQHQGSVGPADVTVATSETAPVLAQHQGNLAVADETVITSLTAPALAQHSAVVPGDVTVQTTMDTPAVVAAGAIAVSNVVVQPTETAPSLAQHSALSVADATVSPALDSPLLDAIGAIAVATVTVGPQLGTPELTAPPPAEVLTVSDLVVRTAIDTPVLLGPEPGTLIFVEDVAVSPILGMPALSSEGPNPNMTTECWPLDTSCCTEEWNAADPATQGYASMMAVRTLRFLTSYRVGGCAQVVRPCKRSCHGQTWETFDVASSGSPGWMNPQIDPVGRWVNIACSCGGDSCSCSTVCQIELGSLIASVDSVVLGALTLDPSAYRVDNGRWLVRTDGECWPVCQDMSAPLGSEGTWSVTYRSGVALDGLAMRAAGVLACEYLKACSGRKCRLPERVVAVTRQGVSMQMKDPSKATAAAQAFPNNLTGIREVDDWIAQINPYGIVAEPSIWFPGMPTPRSTTWSAP